MFDKFWLLIIIIIHLSFERWAGPHWHIGGGGEGCHQPLYLTWCERRPFCLALGIKLNSLGPRNHIASVSSSSKQASKQASAAPLVARWIPHHHHHTALHLILHSCLGTMLMRTPIPLWRPTLHHLDLMMQSWNWMRPLSLLRLP